MVELHFGVIHDIDLDLMPIAQIVTDIYATRTDGDNTAKNLYLGHETAKVVVGIPISLWQL